MKTIPGSFALALVFALASVAPATPAQRGPAPSGPSSNASCPVAGDGCGLNGADCPRVPAINTPVVLTPAAATALVFQIDEERMARELYAAFGARWGLQPFQRIPLAEARHEEMLRTLARHAAVAAPSTVAGRFDSAEVQQRYDALLALGLESADSALRAAAFVEEQDIADLNALIAATDCAELRTVATALRTGSGHHLAAFTGLLENRGVVYQPKVLSVEEYRAILASPAPGSGRRGMRGGRF